MLYAALQCTPLPALTAVYLVAWHAKALLAALASTVPAGAFTLIIGLASMAYLQRGSCLKLIDAVSSCYLG